MTRRLKLSLLVTAGPTVEDLDPVRFISNRASGKLGFEIAKAALKLGHRVTLVHGPVSEHLIENLPRALGLTRVPVRSCAQMSKAVHANLVRTDAVIMSAAVADFTPVKTSATKLKKAQSGLTIRLKPTEDILKGLGRVKAARRKDLVLLGFALETGSGRTKAQRLTAQFREARRKLESKNLDALVLDAPDAMGADRSTFHLLESGRAEAQTVRATKQALAARLVRWCEALHETKRARS